MTPNIFDISIVGRRAQTRILPPLDKAWRQRMLRLSEHLDAIERAAEIASALKELYCSRKHGRAKQWLPEHIEQSERHYFDRNPDRKHLVRLSHAAELSSELGDARRHRVRYGRAFSDIPEAPDGSTFITQLGQDAYTVVSLTTSGELRTSVVFGPSNIGPGGGDLTAALCKQALTPIRALDDDISIFVDARYPHEKMEAAAR